MNRPPHHLGDEVLSAHADGALGTAERDQAIEHLDACPSCAERARALAEASALIRKAKPEPVDEVTRRRMISRALEATPSGQPASLDRRVRIAGLATIAAAVVTVVGMVAFIGDGDKGAETAASSGVLPIGEEEIFADVGELDDPESLRDLLEDAALEETGVEAAGSAGAYAGPESNAGQAAGGGSAGVVSGGGAASGGSDDEVADQDAGQTVEQTPDAQTSEPEIVSETRSETFAAAASPPIPNRLLAPPSPADVSAITKCYRSSDASAFAKDNKLIAAVTGTYAGKKVVVLGFRLGGGPTLLAMVLSRGDCELVNTQSFR
ncbi:MAG: zf-HC2 domain-containing protein [Actinobacteria bacterium]|nr:zf-HC2 domain-containing protein [Actinomycetota bacterium]